MIKLETGDVVKLKEGRRVNTYVVYFVGNTPYLIKDDNTINLTVENVEDNIKEVTRGGEKVFPLDILTNEEKAFFKAFFAFSPNNILTTDTRIMKVSNGTGLTSYIRITGLASCNFENESVNLPSFMTSEHFTGMAKNNVYTLKELGI